MRKLIVKTIFITCGIAFMLLFAIFGIVSFWAPSAMMDLTASLGMETVSGDYAFQEYERSGNLSCLARSFLIAAEHKDDRNAKQRFTILFGTDERDGEANDESGRARREAFEEFCKEQDGAVSQDAPAMAYRDFLCGQAAAVQYRLAKTQAEKDAACTFAAAETEADFPAGNPVIALAVSVGEAKDKETCKVLLTKMSEGGFEQNSDYRNIKTILEAVE